MLFNSIEYFYFLLGVVTLYFAVPFRFRWALLLVASYAFYMSWNPVYVVLILTVTIVNFWAGLKLQRTRSSENRRWVLLVSLVVSLGLLFGFKYWGFFFENLHFLSADIAAWMFEVGEGLLLPVGISFYTFQTLSYTIDVYRGQLRAESHFGRFALYVSFFPQLVAGPIERAGRLLPQFWEEFAFDWDRVSRGLQLILWGLFKKVVIADRLALYVDAVYGNVGHHDGSTYLLATYAFAFQIYCDFSGYTDMARGSAQILGFDLMENFRTPYFAKTIQEFWRRWHISLSTWLRDYLYIPLGGNRGGLRRTQINLALTMLLGGLWHGASWNFVIWGGLQGVFLSLSRATIPFRDQFFQRVRFPSRLRKLIQMAITFNLVCFCWIFFRAETLGDSAEIIARIFSPWERPFLETHTLAHGSVGLALLLFIEMFRERVGSLRDAVSELPIPVRWFAWYMLIFLIITFGVDGGGQFIYFQF
jgi:D-alanyl-lipoteichoic acid acyltransferase DltB (MBOAT superfamily)